MSPENTHKLMGFYMGAVLPGVYTLVHGLLLLQLFSDFCVCLYVCPSAQGLGRPGNDLMVAAGMYGLAGLFASSLQKEVKRCQYYWQ